MSPASKMCIRDSYNAAFTADEQAAASKQAFVQVWNPLAARYGARQETPGNI